MSVIVQITLGVGIHNKRIIHQTKKFYRNYKLSVNRYYNIFINFRLGTIYFIDIDN